MYFKKVSFSLYLNFLFLLAVSVEINVKGMDYLMLEELEITYVKTHPKFVATRLLNLLKTFMTLMTLVAEMMLSVKEMRLTDFEKTTLLLE